MGRCYARVHGHTDRPARHPARSRRGPAPGHGAAAAARRAQGGVRRARFLRRVAAGAVAQRPAGAWGVRQGWAGAGCEGRRGHVRSSSSSVGFAALLSLRPPFAEPALNGAASSQDANRGRLVIRRYGLRLAVTTRYSTREVSSLRRKLQRPSSNSASRAGWPSSAARSRSTGPKQSRYSSNRPPGCRRRPTRTCAVHSTAPRRHPRAGGARDRAGRRRGRKRRAGGGDLRLERARVGGSDKRSRRQFGRRKVLRLWGVVAVVCTLARSAVSRWRTQPAAICVRASTASRPARCS